MIEGQTVTDKDEEDAPLVERPTELFRKANRSRQLYLSTKRMQLQVPIQTVIGVSESLIEEAQEIDQPQFLEDMRRIHQAGRDLLAQVDAVFSSEHVEHPDLRAIQSRMRHDLRAKLNPIISYSEMWLEDDEHFVEGFASDLKRVRDAGRRCMELFDAILHAGAEDPLTPKPTAETGIIGQIRQIGTTEGRPGPVETGQVLVVDDEANNRDITRRQLEAQGHQVTTASNGQEALDLLTTREFDVVLLDIIMPAMNGIEVLQRLKQDVRLRDIPVIMISGLGEKEVVVRCIQLGAEDYLEKPFDPIFLRARIGACLEKRRMREREIDHLSQIEAERSKANELLHVILPEKIVAELKSTNRVVPRSKDDVAVLFADIVNFTQFCGKHDAEEVLKHLQTLVEQWEDSALRYEVTKIKTIGDCFMAASGLLTDEVNPVLNCVRCALEMIQVVHSVPIGWNIRVGIHVGRVVAGVLGRRQYLFDLWGDTVNTAARMESHGVAGAINLSAEAFAKISHVCKGTPRGTLPVKGIGEMEMIRFDGFLEGQS